MEIYLVDEVFEVSIGFYFLSWCYLFVLKSCNENSLCVESIIIMILP